MISKEDKEIIETARKYGLKPGTIKCDIFYLFDKGYSPIEVKFLLRDYITTKYAPILKSINRYYHTRKRAQRNK